MIQIHTISIGTPQTHSDERGNWRSAIFRAPISGPIALGERGLEGDQVADTANHGTADQAVCCHPLAHYDSWNQEYQLDTPERRLGPGSVGENWTLSGMTEADVCIGDIVSVGSAVVQISAPRFPCSKQERKLQLPGFLARTKETLRTGFYLRVLEPGVVQAGDQWILQERRHPEITVHLVNACQHQAPDRELAARLLEVPELAAGWKRIVRHTLAQLAESAGR